MPPPVFVHHVETAVPETAYEQSFVRDLMHAQLGADDRRTSLVIRRIYDQSGISRRHSVVRDLERGARGGPFYDAQSGRLLSPSTGTRNDLYADAATELYARTARAAVENCPGPSAADLTHVITVSCTGFFAPGPDYVVTRALDLPPTTARFHLGFMGCHAAFPALRMARAFCQADPEATVLVVCLELCSLHVQLNDDVDALVAGALFADGAAALVVSARQPQAPHRALEIRGLHSALTPTGEADMAWAIKDSGFEMVLSTYVPAILEANLQPALAPLLEDAGLRPADVGRWAVHPGGRAILDKVQRCLELTDEQLAPSRTVLRDYGNMSSATVLFVLKELLSEPAEPGETVCALAFGPGLTVESALFGRDPRPRV